MRTVIAFLAVLAVAVSAQSPQFETRWTIPGLLDGSSTLLSSGSVLVTNSADGNLTAVTTDGTVAWRVALPEASATLTQISISDGTIVVALYASGESTYAVGYNIADGSVAYQITLPSELSVLSFGKKNLVAGLLALYNFNTTTGNFSVGTRLINYDLSTGEVLWNITDKKILIPPTPGAVAVGKSLVGVLGFPKTGGTVSEIFVHTYDLATGDALTKVPTDPLSESVTLAGDAILGVKADGLFPEVYDGRTGNVIIHIPAVGILGLPAAITEFEGEFYTLDSGNSSVTRYDAKGNIVWQNVKVAAPVNPLFDLNPNFLGLSRLPGPSGEDTVVVNNRQVFTALDKSTGTQLWDTISFLTTIPSHPPNSDNVALFPMDASGKTIFVPNLQGSSFLTRADSKVSDLHLYQPASATYWFHDLDSGDRFVVRADSRSGDLMALQLAAPAKKQ